MMVRRAPPSLLPPSELLSQDKPQLMDTLPSTLSATEDSLESTLTRLRKNMRVMRLPSDPTTTAKREILPLPNLMRLNLMSSAKLMTPRRMDLSTGLLLSLMTSAP